jgi:sulfur-carrier protein
MSKASVTVRFYATLRDKTGCDEVACDAERVRDALSFVEKKFGPEFKKHMRACNVLLNSDNIIFLKGPRTQLKSGDIIHVLPPSGGG